MSIEYFLSRSGTGPNSIGPWSLHMSRPHFGPDPILGTNYKTKFGPDRGTIKLAAEPAILLRQMGNVCEVNPSHAVRDLSCVRQYPPWLLFTAFVDSVGYPRYNPQKTLKQ